jgi:hypothetical protein
MLAKHQQSSPLTYNNNPSQHHQRQNPQHNPNHHPHYLNNNNSETEDGADTDSSLLLMFKCKVCGKGFKHRRSLNRHVKLHSGEKNFHCPYCETAFARSDHLKAHIRTHNNSKPFRCSICQCGYSTQAALKVHIAHHHSKSKFKCVLCNDMEFHSQLALEGHIYKLHSKDTSPGGSTGYLGFDTDEARPQTQSVNSNFANSFNRVHMQADLNGYQGSGGEGSPEFYSEERNGVVESEMFYEGAGEAAMGYESVREGGEENGGEKGAEFGMEEELSGGAVDGREGLEENSDNMGFEDGGHFEDGKDQMQQEVSGIYVVELVRLFSFSLFCRDSIKFYSI